MSDWTVIFVACSYIILYFLREWEEKKHRAEIMRMNDVCREEINEVLESARAEREELLDRIMANNIQEFKSASGQIPVKRSESGNYLVDRMQATLQKQYVKDE